MPSIRHVKGDEEGSADAHHKGNTKTGDKGKPVWPGATVKDNVRVEADGDVDELNSTIGVVWAFNAELVKNHSSADRWEEKLRWIQVYVCGGGEKSLWIRLSYGS